MKKILQNLSGKFAKKDVTGSLKKKAAVCSAEAAAISVAVHVLIIVFAGSIIAYEYIKRQDAAFEGQNVNRPKLERRQLQMPVKVQNLQKKSRRPKVNSRMTSAAKSALALPDMSSLGMGLGKDGDAFGAGGAGGGGGPRELSSMGAAGSLGFGISSVNFFGAKSKGEKIVFIVDTGKAMMEDKKGGYYTYKFAKDRILEMISRMKAATLFNVVLYGGKDKQDVVAQFSSQLLPATVENKEALKTWFEPVNSNPKTVGEINDIENYASSIEYETAVGLRASSWLKAIQAGMEQKADNIFVLLPEWGRISRGGHEDELAEWEKENPVPPALMAKYEKEKAEFAKAVEEVLKKENKARAKKGLPPRIVNNSWDYQEEILSQLPPRPKRPRPKQFVPKKGWIFLEEEIIDHLTAVYRYNYIPEKLKKPMVHMVQLIAADDDEKNDDDVISMRKLTRTFRGDFEYLRGADTMEDLLKYNRKLNEE